jgi:hypothetical protein
MSGRVLHLIQLARNNVRAILGGNNQLATPDKKLAKAKWG